ncbi:homing endonuclease [Acinetobacter phage vB_AbaAut_ChT04]|uniref:Homing endonuclease n=1 Tax=Acinetobacter phage vB_AbaAut_ChT04 TaxID=3041534 RepID=A0AA49FNK3_9CAUD|nr:homing endonuclease [Acinetobacter phage vB_AbaAut_ChT04]
MDCIIGTNIQKTNGYSYRRFKGTVQRSHRVAYILANNLTLEDIKGKVIRHKCDNRACINPDHLEIGTHQDNMNDMTSRNRQAKGEAISNSVLTEDQVRYIRQHYIRRSKEWGTVGLAKKLGCSHRTVQSVVAGTRWSHVT